MQYFSNTARADAPVEGAGFCGAAVWTPRRRTAMQAPMMNAEMAIRCIRVLLEKH
jgi:hypothetical protein